MSTKKLSSISKAIQNLALVSATKVSIKAVSEVQQKKPLISTVLKDQTKAFISIL